MVEGEEGIIVLGTTEVDDEGAAEGEEGTIVFGTTKVDDEGAVEVEGGAIVFGTAEVDDEGAAEEEGRVVSGNIELTTAVANLSGSNTGASANVRLLLLCDSSGVFFADN